MIVVTFLGVFALAYVLWCLSIRRGLRNLHCTRAFSRPAYFVGEESELVEVVRNDSPAVIPMLRVESRISPHIRLGRQDNLHVSGEKYYCSQFALLPYQQIRRRHRVRFLHRGSFNLGSASLTALDIVGLSEFHRVQEADVPVLVYPPLIEDAEIPTPMSTQLREITRQPQLLQDPFLVRGLRTYQPGDPVRDIHWAATARMGDVQVRIHDYCVQTKLLVVLNVQTLDFQWSDQLSEREESLIEYGISLAATACVKGLREGLAVGFAANMTVDREKESVLMLPAEGNGREEELLTTLARLKILRTENFPVLLNDLAAYTGLDMLILSAYDSERIQEALEQLRRSGNQVTFQLLEGGGA